MLSPSIKEGGRLALAEWAPRCLATNWKEEWKKNTEIKPEGWTKQFPIVEGKARLGKKTEIPSYENDTESHETYSGDDGQNNSGYKARLRKGQEPSEFAFFLLDGVVCQDGNLDQLWMRKTEWK